jgi:hypothetical protein
VLAGAAMFLLVFPLAQGHSLGWPSWLSGMPGGSVLMLAGFGWYQVRRQRAGRDPLVEPSIFRHRPYSAGIVFWIVFTGSLGGIVMAGVQPREMGSASGVLQTVNALGVSLGIAGIGAIFFALASGRGGHVPVYLNAAQWTTLATVGLLACSFVIGFGLPRRAREQ